MIKTRVSIGALQSVEMSAGISLAHKNLLRYKRMQEAVHSLHAKRLNETQRCVNAEALSTEWKAYHPNSCHASLTSFAQM